VRPGAADEINVVRERFLLTLAATEHIGHSPDAWNVTRTDRPGGADKNIGAEKWERGLNFFAPIFLSVDSCHSSDS
ncbi:MAG TPA: hypothetical protein VGH32_10230, partial [Pirellulales bacterium]